MPGTPKGNVFLHVPVIRSFSDWVYFVVGSAETPGAPTITSPDPNTTYEPPPQPTIQWNAVDGALYYYLNILDRSTNYWLLLYDLIVWNGYATFLEWADWGNIELLEYHLYGICVQAGNVFGWGGGTWLNFHVGDEILPHAAVVTGPSGDWVDPAAAIFWYHAVGDAPADENFTVKGAFSYYVELIDVDTNTAVDSPWIPGFQGQ